MSSNAPAPYSNASSRRAAASAAVAATADVEPLMQSTSTVTILGARSEDEFINEVKHQMLDNPSTRSAWTKQTCKAVKKIVKRFCDKENDGEISAHRLFNKKSKVMTLPWKNWNTAQQALAKNVYMVTNDDKLVHKGTEVIAIEDWHSRFLSVYSTDKKFALKRASNDNLTQTTIKSVTQIMSKKYHFNATLLGKCILAEEPTLLAQQLAAAPPSQTQGSIALNNGAGELARSEPTVAPPSQAHDSVVASVALSALPSPVMPRSPTQANQALSGTMLMERSFPSAGLQSLLAGASIQSLTVIQGIEGNYCPVSNVTNTNNDNRTRVTNKTEGNGNMLRDIKNRVTDIQQNVGQTRRDIEVLSSVKKQRGAPKVPGLRDLQSALFQSPTRAGAGHHFSSPSRRFHKDEDDDENINQPVHRGRDPPSVNFDGNRLGTEAFNCPVVGAQSPSNSPVLGGLGAEAFNCPVVGAQENSPVLGGLGAEAVNCPVVGARDSPNSPVLGGLGAEAVNSPAGGARDSPNSPVVDGVGLGNNSYEDEIFYTPEETRQLSLTTGSSLNKDEYGYANQLSRLGGKDPSSSPKKVLEQRLSPLQSYKMSDREESDSDFESGDEDKRQRPNMPIPLWAQQDNLNRALECQFADGPDRLDPDKIFGEVFTCNLEEIFDQKKSRYQSRTSSSNWTKDHATLAEKLTYKRTIGYEDENAVNHSPSKDLRQSPTDGPDDEDADNFKRSG